MQQSQEQPRKVNVMDLFGTSMQQHAGLQPNDAAPPPKKINVHDLFNLG